MKYENTSVSANHASDSLPSASTISKLPDWSANATPMVSARPNRSETQPQKIRLPPFASGLSDAASVSVATPIPHECAIGPACAVTSRPPVAIITIIAYSA